MILRESIVNLRGANELHKSRKYSPIKQYLFHRVDKGARVAVKMIHVVCVMAAKLGKLVTED